MKCLLLFLPCLASCPKLPALTTQPTSRPVVTVDSVLDRLEAEGQRVNDFHSGIVWRIEDARLFEMTEKRGSLMFLRTEPNPLFRIDFTQLLESGTVKNRQEQHVFDGRWYTESREFTRTVIRREVVRKGETVDLFNIGSGPFPLPFGQKKQDILRHFKVTLLHTLEAGSDAFHHLRCVPRRSSHLADDYREIHFHIDRKLGLPVSIVLYRKKDGKVVTVDFKRVRINTGLERSLFEVNPPKGWHTITEPLPKS